MDSKEQRFYYWLYRREPDKTKELELAWQNGWDSCRDFVKGALSKHLNTQGVIRTMALEELISFIWHET